jgi:DNA-binding PadR family transcriptional regulator
MRAAAAWPSEFILLGLLCEQAGYGYDLHRRVQGDAALRAIWRIERSQLYFLLHKLADQGLIAAQGAAQGQGPARLLYTPTPAGQAAFDAWLARPESPPHNLRAAFLAKLYLALRVRPAAVAGLLAAQEAVLGEWASRWRARADATTFAGQVYRLRLAQIEAAQDWLAALRHQVAQGVLPGVAAPPVPQENADVHARD